MHRTLSSSGLPRASLWRDETLDISLREIYLFAFLAFSLYTKKGIIEVRFEFYVKNRLTYATDFNSGRHLLYRNLITVCLSKEVRDMYDLEMNLYFLCSILNKCVYGENVIK